MVKAPTKREQDSLKKKRHIFRKAMDLFRRYGFEKTTIQDIAEASGMSSGSIYNFFGSKEGILDWTIEDIKTVMIPQADWDEKVKDPYPVLLKYVCERMEIWNEFGADLTVHMAAEYCRKRYDEDGFFCTEEGLGNLPEFIESCQYAGTFDDIISPRYAANYLLSAARGLVLEWCDFGGSYDLPDRVRRFMPRVINSFLPYDLRRPD